MMGKVERGREKKKRGKRGHKKRVKRAARGTRENIFMEFIDHFNYGRP